MIRRLFKLFLLILLVLAPYANAKPASAKRPTKKATRKTKRFKVLKAKSKGFKEIYDNKLHRKRLMKDTVIIKFKPNLYQHEINFYLQQHELEIVEELTSNIYLCKPNTNQGLELDNGLVSTSFARVVNQIADDSIVESYDIDEYKKLKTESLKSTKQSRLEWHLKNDGKNGLRAGADINIEEAWAQSKGQGMKVAVIDTGFDMGHYDIDYASGYDAIKDITGDASAPISSNENHGTAVAGIIAAKDNKKGVVGVAPESQIVPIRLIDDSGSVSISQIIKAFKKADELGAKIINNSWGSYDPSLPEGEQLEITELEKEMYQDIAKNGNNGKGILIIFASGNTSDRDFNNAPEARLPETMAVGATDSTDRRSSYSVFGKELDIVAPGGGFKTILTTDRRDVKKGKKRKVAGYSKGSVAKGFRGTSAAAPVVAGVAALVWSVNPSLTADEVRQIITLSANKRMNGQYDFDENGKNIQVGHGRVDAAAAVELAASGFIAN